MADNPTLDNLPKVDADLKSELEKFKTEKMKPTETQIKVVLPSAEGTDLYLNAHLLILFARLH